MTVARSERAIAPRIGPNALLDHLRTPHLRNGYFLMLSSGSAAAVGLVYWVIAARLYSEVTVGLSSAAVAAIMFLAGVAQLNLQSGILRFLPTAGSRSRQLIGYAYAASTLLSLVAAAIFLLGLPVWSPGLSFLRSNAGVAVWFVIGTATWNIFSLQDNVLTGLRQTMWVPVENVLFALAKIGLLIVFAPRLPAFGILLSFTIPSCLATVPVTLLVLFRWVPRHVASTRTVVAPFGARQVARFVAGNYLAGLFSMASGLILPLVVAGVAGARANAFFYQPWVFATALQFMLWNMTSSLVVEGSRDRGQLDHFARQQFVQMLRIAVPVALVGLLASPLVLHPFGTRYAQQGAPLLRLLLVAVVPSTVTAIFLGVARVREAVREIVAVQSALCVLVVGLGFPLLHLFGITGVGVAWLLAQSGVAGSLLVTRMRSILLSASRGVPTPGAAGRTAFGVRLLSSAFSRIDVLDVLNVVALGGSALLWAVSLGQIEPGRMNDFGLISVLPETFFSALAVCAIAFCVTVQDPRAREVWLFAQVVMVTLIMRATPAIVYGTVRYSWTYKHIGIIDYIHRHGTVDRSIAYLNVYHNWPGFFALGAFLTEATGLRSALSFAAWAPPFFGVVYILALRLVYRGWTVDTRRVWVAIWIFSLANWVGQDYFSPQALGFVFFLVIIGITVRWFPDMPHRHFGLARHLAAYLRPDDDRPSAQGLVGSAQAAMIGMLVLTCFAMVATHQLTPFMALTGLTLLAVFRRAGPRWLPLLLAGMTAFWYLVVAAPFVFHQTDLIAGSFGDVTQNVRVVNGANFRAPASQVLIGHLALLLDSFPPALAVAGVVRRLRLKLADPACLLLLSAPFAWPLVTHYGDEIILRVVLFSLPFSAYLGAGLMFSQAWSRPRFSLALTLVISGLLLAGLNVVYYGLERENYLSPKELAAVEDFYRIAPPGSLLIEGSNDAPLPYQNYELYTYFNIENQSYWWRVRMDRHPAQALANTMVQTHHPAAYVIFSVSQDAHYYLSGMPPVGLLSRLAREVSRSPDFHLVYGNSDARIYQLRPDGPRDGRVSGENDAGREAGPTTPHRRWQLNIPPSASGAVVVISESGADTAAARADSSSRLIGEAPIAPGGAAEVSLPASAHSATVVPTRPITAELMAAVGGRTASYSGPPKVTS